MKWLRHRYAKSLFVFLFFSLFSLGLASTIEERQSDFLWKLDFIKWSDGSKYFGDVEERLPAGLFATVVFGGDSILVLESPCNTCTFSFQLLEGNQLSIVSKGCTRAACDNESMEWEKKLVAYISTAYKLERERQYLRIHFESKKEKGVLQFKDGSI